MKIEHAMPKRVFGLTRIEAREDAAMTNNNKADRQKARQLDGTITLLERDEESFHMGQIIKAFAR